MQLFIQKPGTFITQKDECFLLKNQDDKREYSPLKVESLVLTHQAMISTQAVVMALKHNIDIVFLDKYGDPLGRIWFPRMGSTTLIRRKQLEAAENSFGTELVKDLIVRKMENQERFLKKLMQSRPGSEDIFLPALDSIAGEKNALAQENRPLGEIRDRIRGLEGSAGRAYFQSLSKIMPESFQFEKRSKRPAEDPFNAALNYGYGMLYSRVEKACILAGLDPYIGFLHADQYNKVSLVYDLIEPFRIFAEQSVVYLFTGRKMKQEFFDIAPGDVSLNSAGKPAVVSAMTEYMEESVRYRKRNVKRMHIIQHEAHRLANMLIGDNPEFQRHEWLEMEEF